MPFRKQITVCVMAVEKGDNYKDTQEALSKQTIPFILEQIEDYTPMYMACNEMLNRCNTPYFIQCDEDMVLYPNAVETMYNIIKDSASNVSHIKFRLLDDFSQKIIGSCNIYRTNIVKNYPFRKNFCTELDQMERIKAGGYIIKNNQTVVGVHSPHWTNKSIFAHYYNLGQRTAQKEIHSEWGEDLRNIYITRQDVLSFFAFIGYLSGVLNNKHDTYERDYSTYVQEEYEKVNTIFIDPYKNKFISPENKHPYLLTLSKYIDIEFETDLEKIKKTNKALILWNPYGYFKLKTQKYKYDLYQYFKQNNKLVYSFERGALPKTISLDKDGLLVDSIAYSQERWQKTLSPEQNQKIINYIQEFVSDIDTLEPQMLNLRLVKDDFYNKLNLSDNRKKIFIPLQVFDDTVIILWSDWVESLQNFQKIILSLAKENPNIDFLIKNHPVQKEYKKYLLTNETDNIKIVDDFHYKDCIKYSDIILTINSGIGLQAMMWEKPVIVCGKAFYQFDDINYKANSKDDILNFILNPKLPNWEKIKQFLYYLKFEFYSDATMEKLCGIKSILKNIERLVYYDKNNNCKIIESPISNDKQKIEQQNNEVIQVSLQEQIFQILKLFKPILLKQSCLEVIKEKNLTPTTLYLGLQNGTEVLENEFMKIGFKKENNYLKNANYIIYIEKYNKNYKFCECSGFKVKVPFPVIPYLQNLYGMDWKNYKLDKE